MIKAKNGGQYQKQYFLCILAYGVEVKAQKYYIHWLLSLSVVVVVFQRDEN
jgi:hypothetical protein